MEQWGFLAAALAIGFLGSSHCIGMCGGISGALGMAVPGQKPVWSRLIGYSAGRVTSYALMGFLVGTIGAFVATDLAATLAPLRVVAGLMLIAMALYLADWWRGLVWLERGGRVFWRYLQPMSRTLLPVQTTPQAVALGALWGWLPCGLVYSALTFALAQGSGTNAMLAMLAFGLGTVPAVLATGAAAAQLRSLVRKPGVRLLMALLVLMFGLWTLWGGLSHSGHQHHSDQQHEMIEGHQSQEQLPAMHHGHDSPDQQPADNHDQHGDHEIPDSEQPPAEDHHSAGHHH